MKKLSGFAIILFLILISVIYWKINRLGKSQSKNEDVVFSDNFNSDLNNWAFEEANPDRIKIVEDPLDSTNKVLKITVYPGDIAAKKNRAEIKFKDKEFEHKNFYNQEEIWYSWKFLIPEDYTDHSLSSLQIMGQWHQWYPKGQDFGYFEKVYGKNIAPSISLNYGRSGNISGVMLYLSFDPKVKSETFGPLYIKKGEWNEVKFNIKWSDSNNGFVAAYLNGKPFILNSKENRRYGRNILTNQGDYFKLGLYRGEGLDSVNSVYFDDVRIWKFSGR